MGVAVPQALGVAHEGRVEGVDHLVLVAPDDAPGGGVDFHHAREGHMRAFAEVAVVERQDVSARQRHGGVLVRHQRRRQVQPHGPAGLVHADDAGRGAQAHQHAAVGRHAQAVHQGPVVAAEAGVYGKGRRVEVFPGLPLPDQRALAVDLADHVAVHGLLRAVGGAAGHPFREALGDRFAGGIEQVAVGQPLRVVVVGRVLVAPHHLADRGHFVEVAAMPHRPGRVAVGRLRVAAVVAEVAVGQDDRVAPRAHGQLPFVDHGATDVDEVDAPAGGLRGDERVAPGAEMRVMGDQPHAAAALGDLVNGGGHRKSSFAFSGWSVCRAVLKETLCSCHRQE